VSLAPLWQNLCSQIRAQSHLPVRLVLALFTVTSYLTSLHKCHSPHFPACFSVTMPHSLPVASTRAFVRAVSTKSCHLFEDILRRFCRPRSSLRSTIVVIQDHGSGNNSTCAETATRRCRRHSQGTHLYFERGRRLYVAAHRIAPQMARGQWTMLCVQCSQGGEQQQRGGIQATT
jgi:hypothetical protein